MGGLWARMPAIRSKPPPGTKISGFGTRLINMVKCHYKGWVGAIFVAILFPLMFKMHEHDKTVEIMWLTMLWFFFFQPVRIPVTCMLPIFVMPLLGVVPSAVIVKNFMNENIQLYILSSALVLLLNNTGADRRIALWFICSGDNCQFSGKRLVFKFSMAAFFLSMFSSRIITSSTIIQYAVPPLMSLQAATAKLRDVEPDFDKMRDIIVSAIHTSCSIGSIAIIHASPTMLAMKAMFTEYPGAKKMYPDCFNYLQYSVYAFPTAFAIHLLNFSYHMLLINNALKHPMSASSRTTLRTEYLKYKSKIPKRTTLHEKYSFLFIVIYLLVFFLRWSSYLNMGWADFSKETAGGSADIPACKDATVAAIFMTVLHILPKSFDFLKIWDAEKKSDLPPLKMESSILFWRFVDKNINYSYLFVIGSGVALCQCARDTGLGLTIRENLGKKLTDYSLNGGLFMMCFVAAILSNVITGISALVILLPFVLCSTGTEAPIKKLLRFQDSGADAGAGAGAEPGPDPEPEPEPPEDIWINRQYLCALGVGVICTMSFMWPFLNSPSYFAKSIGKMKSKIVCKYGLGSTIIGMLVVWISLVVWAPIVWDPEGKGISMVEEPYEGVSTTTTMAPPEAGEAGEAGEPPGAPEPEFLI